MSATQVADRQLPSTSVTTTGTQTITNKRINPRVGEIASSATPLISMDTMDMFKITALAVDITGFGLTGTAVDGQKMWVTIIPTATRFITWGSSFESSLVALPTTTGSATRLDVGFVWNPITSKLRCVAVA